MGRLHSAAFRWCKFWKRSAEDVSTLPNEKLHPCESVFQIRSWTVSIKQNTGWAFCSSGDSGGGWGCKLNKEKMLCRWLHAMFFLFLFLPLTESVPVYHHRAGYRHGGQPELRPLQYSHCHHRCHRHQRQPPDADIEDCELLQKKTE